jgi:ABC-type multidrug transport system fused ATPase/permease subunit
VQIFKYVIRCLGILSPGDRRKYWFVLTVQSLLGFLDLVGVAILGIIGALALRGVQSQSPNPRIVDFLEFIGLDNLSLQTQISVLTAMAVTVLVGKSLVTVFLTRRILYFLVSKSSKVTRTMISKIIARPIVDLNAINSYELQYVFGSGVPLVVIGILGSFMTFISDFSLLLILVVGIAVVDPGMALFSTLLFGFVGFALYYILHKRAKLIGSELAETNIQSQSKLHELIYAYREIYVRNRRFSYAQQIANLKERNSYLLAEQNFMPNISKYAVEITLILGGSMIAAFQFYSHSASRAFAGLSIFIAAGSRIAPALLRAQQNLVQMHSNMGATENTLNLLEKLKTHRSLQVEENEVSSMHAGFMPEIAIKNVSFSYPADSSFAIQNLSLSIKEGEYIAFVGASGSGKSTLIDIILGLHHPETGSITISGHSPQACLQMWPGAISYVPQNVHVVEGTVRENICLGLLPQEVSDEAILQAAQRASLSDFIQKLPKGLDSHVFDNATSISGGQRQRIGIARALLTQPRLLFLDEATSSLDGQTEDDVANALFSLKGSITVVMIAHRLSTIRKADKIFCLNQGAITGSGTFEELKKSNPDFEKQASLMGL